MFCQLTTCNHQAAADASDVSSDEEPHPRQMPAGSSAYPRSTPHPTAPPPPRYPVTHRAVGENFVDPRYRSQTQREMDPRLIASPAAGQQQQQPVAGRQQTYLQYGVMPPQDFAGSASAQPSPPNWSYNTQPNTGTLNPAYAFNPYEMPPPSAPYGYQAAQYQVPAGTQQFYDPTAYVVQGTNNPYAPPPTQSYFTPYPPYPPPQ